MGGEERPPFALPRPLFDQRDAQGILVVDRLYLLDWMADTKFYILTYIEDIPNIL